MHLTVAICTWNRSSLLAQTLERMTELRVPADVTWELLVVDNNSTDDTSSVIKSFNGRLPLRGLFEPAPGVSNAKNLAVQEAAGTYIVWTDDDVLVEPTWVAAYHRAFTARPTAAFFGGVIDPWFPEEPPEWLRRGFDHVASAYAARNLGPTEFPLSPQMLPYGANMAIRVAEQRKFAFDRTLGPRPGSELRGEEIDLFLRMLDNGEQGFWVPDAVVKHYIPPKRQTLKYLKDYYRGHGEYLARYGAEPKTKRLLGKPHWMWRSVIESELSYRVTRMFSGPEKWMPKLRDASIARGQFSKG